MGNDTVWSSGLMVLAFGSGLGAYSAHWGDKMPLRPRTPTISASIGQATMSMDGTDDGKGEVIWETVLYGHRGSWWLPLEAVWERTHWGDGDLPGARKLAHHHVVKCL